MFLFHDDIKLRKRFPDIRVKIHVLELSRRQYKTMLKSKDSISQDRPGLSHHRDLFTHMEKQNSSEKWLALAIANLFIIYRIRLGGKQTQEVKINVVTGGPLQPGSTFNTRTWKTRRTLHCGNLMVSEWCKHFSPISFFFFTINETTPPSVAKEQGTLSKHRFGTKKRLSYLFVFFSCFFPLFSVWKTHSSFRLQICCISRLQKSLSSLYFSAICYTCMVVIALNTAF